MLQLVYSRRKACNKKQVKKKKTCKSDYGGSDRQVEIVAFFCVCVCLSSSNYKNFYYKKPKYLVHKKTKHLVNKWALGACGLVNVKQWGLWHAGP